MDPFDLYLARLNRMLKLLQLSMGEHPTGLPVEDAYRMKSAYGELYWDIEMKKRKGCASQQQLILFKGARKRALAVVAEYNKRCLLFRQCISIM